MEDNLIKEQFELLFENPMVGYIIKYPNDKVIANKTFRDLIGYLPEDFINHDWKRYTHPDDIENDFKMVSSLSYNSKHSISWEKRLIHKNSQIVWVEINVSIKYDELGNIKYYLFSFIDITQRKKTERALKISEEKFRNLVWDMSVGVLLQGPNAEILISNPKALEFLGLTEDQLLGKTSFDEDWNVIHEDGSDFPGPTHPVPQAIATKKPFHNVVMGVYRPKSKDRVWLLVDAVPQLNADESVRYVVCTFIDITDLKNATEELKLSKMIIEDNLNQNKELLKVVTESETKLKEIVASKDKFFSIIAHDLRSPFNGFLGLTKIMVEEINNLTINEIQDYCSNLRASASNLYKLLENLLEWSRMQRGTVKFNPEQCILWFIVQQNIDIHLELAKTKSIELINLVPKDEIIFGDVAMINSILRNLISNAVKFTPQFGKVEIGCISKDLVIDNLSKRVLEIYVKDSGIGIPENILVDLFKIDKVVSRPGTEGEASSGLGLLLCKEFVEKHGGEMWVETKEGEGTTFYFYL